ncbi:uncharacterized protein LOC109716289 isoform X2 [Ananas comosus]|uniref:Uncharacterized protein LOC109716289 isoform X2 n=1 Tax=Ananas comosus TaxID=4615 RepID=A0A6P5FW02_ANACO|nr:uncharacterized protein LOC109716289 isoform X2 [Ananas comosus]
MAATSPPLPPPSSLALLLFFAPFLLLLLLLLLSLHLKAQHKNNEAHEAQRSSHTPPEAACGVGEGEEEESERRKGEEKKRKKRGRKKRQGGEEAKDGAAAAPAAAGAAEEEVEGGDKRWREAAVGCPFPLSSFGSAMQRRIKSQYDELVKSSHAKVGQFINCLVEARNELQHKSVIIQRSFKIKKALLFKADRSSFDRLCQQMYKLEVEHKRLKEDAAVYNLVQEQLKLSPAYKTMLEISASMEKVPTEGTAELPDISFEELLAQEKKDSFWQRNGKLRSFPS